nr:hypothetical protein Iba_chr01cCG1010 [Ipomoea batatas]
MGFLTNPNAENEDLQSHLNPRAELSHNHSEEVPIQDSVNIIYELRRPARDRLGSFEVLKVDTALRRSAFERLKPSAQDQLGVRDEGRLSVDRSAGSNRGDTGESSTSRSQRHRARARATEGCGELPRRS